MKYAAHAGTKNFRLDRYLEKFVDAGVWPEQFPYLSKTLLAFQKIDGLDVCFFSVFVQEYNSQCLKPNTRRVYLSYLDSIHFFRPKELRTLVYYEILLGYFDYVRNLGFTKVHLWACPPKDGEDYVFYCHPSEQRTPCAKKLLMWYKIMLDKAIEKKIVKEYKNIYTQAIEDNLKDVSELPYFEGDFLPITLEKEIHKLGESSESENASTSVTKTRLSVINEQMKQDLNKLKKKIPVTKYKKSKKSVKTIKIISGYTVGDPLTDRVLSLLQYHKEGFLVIHLAHNVSEPDLSAIIDPDPLVLSGVMCSREAFLEFCRENDHEFSSLRRAKYSTMALLYELHRENTDAFSCNHCKKVLALGFHCTVCKDFDLCCDCYNLNGHEHQMEDLKIDSLSKSCMFLPSNFADKSTGFDHTSVCNDANCQKVFCKSFKKLIEHFARCGRQRNYCKYCYLCFPLINKHSKNCKKVKCLIQECRRIKFFSGNWRQNVEGNQNCLLNSGNFQRFCSSYTICLCQESQSSKTSVNNKIPPVDNQKSSAYITSFKTTLPNDSLSCVSATIGKAVQNTNEPQNESLGKTKCQSHFTKITKIMPRNKLKNRLKQTFIMSNNGLVLGFHENIPEYDEVQKMDTIVFSNKQFKTENILNRNMCDDITDFSSIPHSKESLLTSDLETASFIMSDIQQNNTNISHPKLKLSDKNIHYVKENGIFSHQTGQNSDYISGISLKRKLPSDILEQQSLASKSVPLHNTSINVDFNSNSYVFTQNKKNAENPVLNVENSDFTPQVLTVSAKQQPFVSLTGPKEQASTKHENFVSYSDVHSFSSKLPACNSSNISNVRKWISLSCTKTNQLNRVKDKKTACIAEKKYLTSDIQKNYCTSVLSERNNQNISLNISTNSYPMPIYSKVEQIKKRSLNKSNCSSTNSPKVNVYETIKTLEDSCKIDSMLNFKFSIPRTSNVNTRNNEDLYALGQSKLSESLNDKRTTIAPVNKYYLTSVTSTSSSSKSNLSFSKSNIEYLIPNAFKVTSRPVNPELDSSEISVKALSNAGEIRNLSKKKMAISTNKHSTFFALTKSKKRSLYSKLHLVALKKPRFVKCNDNVTQTTQESNSTLSPIASNVFKGMTYSALASTSNSVQQFSVNKHVPLSMDCKLSKSEIKSKPIVPSYNMHSSDLAVNKIEHKNSLVPEKSNLNLNEIHSKQINYVAQIDCKSNTKSYQTLPAKTNSIDTETFNENRSTYSYPSNFSVYQLFKDNAGQQYCHESFMSKNKSNDDKTLPAFEDFCRNSNFDILKGKKMPSTLDLLPSENLQAQIQNIPSYSIPSKTFHDCETYFNKSNKLQIRASLNITSETPNFNCLTSCIPTMHVTSDNGAFHSSFKNVKGEQKSVNFTYVNPNAVCGYEDQNTPYIKIPIASQNVSPLHTLPDMISKNQNAVPYDYRSTSTISNTQSQAISKSNKISFLGSSPMQPTYMSLESNKNSVFCLTPSFSNKSSSVSEKDCAFKQKSIPVLDNISKPVNFQYMDASASNSVELSLNGSQISYSNLVPFAYSYNVGNPAHFDNSGNFSVISSQSVSLHEPQNCEKGVHKTNYKDSHSMYNNSSNSGSLLTGSKFCVGSKAQFYFHDQSGVQKIAASPVQHSHLSCALLNYNPFQRSCKTKLKQSNVLKRASCGKRGRKKSGSII